MKKFLSLILFFAIIFPTLSFGQAINIPSGIEEQVNLTITPSIPKPGESVTATVSVFSTDLNSSKITWKINGSIVSEGVGQKKYTFEAPRLGDSADLSVSITKQSGEVLTESLKITPGEVEILYDTNNYIPPFYKGARLFTNESEITFFAVANLINSAGTRINPDSLIYTWKSDGSVVNGASGAGRKTFKFKGGIIQRTMNISVEVTDPAGNFKAKDNVLVDDVSPEIIFYENNPIYGLIFSKAILGQFNLNRQEVEIEAVPFFFSTSRDDSGVVEYSWSMNGKDIESPSFDNQLILRNENQSEGFSRISLEAKHRENILQASSGNFGVYFGLNE